MNCTREWTYLKEKTANCLLRLDNRYKCHEYRRVGDYSSYRDQFFQDYSKRSRCQVQ